MLKSWLAACAVLLALTPAAKAQENLPNQYRSHVFVEAIAQRGLQCDLLRPWQSAALSVQVADAAYRWSEEQRAQLQSDAATQAQAWACDDATLNAWIDGASRGFESEMLAHFIVIYTALSELDPPLGLFTQSTRLETHAEARAAIAAKLTELEAAGAVAEGGRPWPDFIARTSEQTTEIARAYEAGALPERYTPAQIEALIQGAVRVTELWLSDSAED